MQHFYIDFNEWQVFKSINLIRHRLPMYEIDAATVATLVL